MDFDQDSPDPLGQVRDLWLWSAGALLPLFT
jgi:hypothetical protein